jgi:hypothetical protein
VTRLVAIAALAALLVGCVHGPDRLGPRTAACDCGALAPDGGPRSVREIELLAYPDCPHAGALRESLRAALDAAGEGVGIREVNMETLSEDDPRRGWPAPTVLVDGEDLFGMTRPPPAPRTCRVYADGLPGTEAIAARLQRRLCRGPCAARGSCPPRS